MISGFHHKVGEICALLGYYTVHSGNYLPTFQDNVLVPSRRIKKPWKGGSFLLGFLDPWTGTDKLSQKSVTNYHYMQHNAPEEHRSHKTGTGNYMLHTRMNTNTEAQLFSLPVFDLKTFYFFEKMESHGCNFSSVSVTITHWKTTRNHVSISNCLNFIHIIVWYDGVTAGVKVI